MQINIIEKIMLEAITLAGKSLNRTLPNPRVGAVIFDDAGNVLGTGYHKSFGSPHAEIEAISDAVSKGHDIRDCNICVTLEPCNHQGKTPPCTNAILDIGLKAVFIGTKDTSTDVCGRGMEHLLASGLEVECGFLEDQCRELNQGFNKFNSTGLPFVRIKSAISLNGKISCRDTSTKTSGRNSEDNWFTGEEARYFVHKIRSYSDLILTGIGTIKDDNPSLNVRLDEDIKPSNVAILDPRLELLDEYISGKLNVISSGNRVFIVCDKDFKNNQISEKLRGSNINLVKTEIDEKGLIDLKVLFKKLAVEYGFREILVEAGEKLTISCLELSAPYIDRITLFIAPVWFNNSEKSFFTDDTVFPDFKILDTKLLGNTVCLEISQVSVAVKDSSATGH